MIILSMNIRGVGGAQKLLALRRVCENVRPDILMIQETMVTAEKAIDVFSKVVGSWNISAVDAIGLLGGLLTAWNPKKANFVVFKTVAGILLQGRYLNGDRELKILNCYGPYQNRIPYWNLIRDSGLLKEEGLIIGGDLNFTVSANETWGCTCMDPEADFFYNLFREEGLLDVEPSVLRPTWQNGRGGSAGIGKRLDRFLADVDMLE